MNLLKLKPACKDYIWGGNKLKSEFGKETSMDILAETWELSTHPDGPSIIANGTLAGTSFRKYVQENSSRVLGTNCDKFDDFPILIKFIDAQDNLSIQVHPNNEYAQKHENQYGKTEVWYIVDCKPDSYIYFGMAKEITKKDFQTRIENNTLLEVLNKVPVKKGEVYFIEAGTIHAICKDIIIAEIQQNSNVTYRVYDYDRRDKEGNSRELHIQKAMDVTNLKPVSKQKNNHGHLSQCAYFTVDKIELNHNTFQKPRNSETFFHVLVVEGEGDIQVDHSKLSYVKGDSFFLPASQKGEISHLTLTGTGTLLLTSVE